MVLQGRGVFVSEQQNNTNRLHTNQNCNVVQDSVQNTYDTIVLQTTINRTYNVNVPRKKLQINADANIEDYIRSRAE